VFLAMTAGVLGAALGEWKHLVSALARPFHVGPPPPPLLLLGSALAAMGALRLLWALARRRSAPFWASLLILAGVSVTVLATAGRAPPERSEPRANLALLEGARRLHVAMVDTLQRTGEVPVADAPWRAALEAARMRGDLYRTRRFQPLPPTLVRTATPEALPQPLQPGCLLLHVSGDGAAFDVRAVGLQDGQPALLKDDKGEVLVLRGLYNPDL
jgi:hypothetical protein